MDRRHALAVAAAAGATVLAASAAVAANVGLLGADEDDPVGTLDAGNVSELLPAGTTTATSPITVIIEDPALTVPPAAPTVAPVVPPPPAPTSPVTVDDDGDGDDSSGRGRGRGRGGDDDDGGDDDSSGSGSGGDDDD